MADNILKVGAEVDNQAVKTGMQEAVTTTKAATEEMSAAFEKHAEAVSKALNSLGDASKAMGSELGGEVAGLIAELPGLAAAIEAATSATGAIALIGVLAQVAEKIYTVTESLTHLSDEEKRNLQEATREANNHLRVREAEVRAAYELQIANAKDDISKQELRVKEQAALVDINKDYVHQLEAERDRLDGLIGGAKELANTYGQAMEGADPDAQGALALLQYLSNKKAENIKDSKEYKDVLDEIAIANARVTSQTAEQINAENTLADNQKRDAERRAAEAKKEADRRAEERRRVHEIELDAAKTHDEALGRIELQRLDFERQTGRLSEEEYESRMQGQLALTYAEARQELEIKLKAAAKQPEEYARIKAEIQKLDDQYQAQSEKQEQDAAVRKQQRAEAEQKKLDDIKKRSNEIEQDAARAHTEAVGQLQLQRLDFERQIGHRSESQYEKELQDQLRATYEAVHKELEIKRDAAAQDPVEYARINAQIQKLEDKFTLDSEKREQQSLLRRRQRFDQLFQHISGSFTNALNSWIQGTESFSQAWTKMAQDMAMQFISSLEKQLMSFIEHKLMEVAIHAEAEQTKDAVDQVNQAKEDKRSAYGAAKKAYKWATDWGGPVAGAIAATVAFIGVEAIGSAEGGQWEVPGIQPTILHPQEMVLPAGIASRMRDMVEQGGRLGSGGTGLVFAPTIHALDAQGVDRVLTRHQRIFENRVDKVLRKRGLFAR